MSTTCPHCGRSGPRTGPACGHCGQPWGQGPSEWRTTAERVGLPPAAVDTAEQPIVRPGAAAVHGGGSRVVWVAAALATLAIAGLAYWFVKQSDPPQPLAVETAARAMSNRAEPRALTENAAPAPPPAQTETTLTETTLTAGAAGTSAAATLQPPAIAPGAATGAGATDWPPRLEEKALWLAFEAALAQGSVRGALEAVHCTPRPCVVFGRLNDGVDAVRLLDAPQLAEYQDDRRFIYRWTERSAGMDGQSHLAAHFALAFIPKDLDATTRADLERSVSQRTAQRRARAPDTAAESEPVRP